MGRNKQVECRICMMQMRSDHLDRHMEQHEKKTNGIDETGCFRSGVCGMVGKHKQVVCKICLKKMTSNNLKRHKKKT